MKRFKLSQIVKKQKPLILLCFPRPFPVYKNSIYLVYEFRVRSGEEPIQQIKAWD
jgi:hypothetical protein